MNRVESSEQFTNRGLIKMRTKGSIKMTYVFETINWNKKKEKDPCDGCYGSCNGCPYKNY